MMKSQLDSSPAIVKLWTADIYRNSMGRAVFDTLVVAGLFFYLTGTAENHSRIFLDLFVVFYIPIAVLTASAETMYDTRRRHLCLVLSNKEEVAYGFTSYPGGATFPVHAQRGFWYLLVPCSALVSVAFIIVLLLFLRQFEVGGTALMLTILGSIIAIVGASAITVRMVVSAYQRDSQVVASAMNSISEDDSDNRIFADYLLPWSLIATAVCALIAYKYFSEVALQAGQDIEVSKAAFSIGGSALVIASWICFAVQKQADADIRLGQIVISRADRVSDTDLFFLLHVVPVVGISTVFMLGRVFSVEHFTVIQAVSIEAVVGGCAAVCGAILGVSWSGTKLRSKAVV